MQLEVAGRRPVRATCIACVGIFGGQRTIAQPSYIGLPTIRALLLTRNLREFVDGLLGARKGRGFTTCRWCHARRGRATRLCYLQNAGRYLGEEGNLNDKDW
jgi:hypothetical protein